MGFFLLVGEMELSDRDLQRLAGVHPDLVRVVKRAAYMANDEEFIVTEGLRTKERQAVLFAQGKSKTMDSRHITGHAVDLAAWYDRDMDKVVDADELSWKFQDYKLLNDLMQEAAKYEKVPIVWGGSWTSFKDGPHWELDRATYPA